MNPHLAQRHPCPFNKLRHLFAGITPPAGLKEIRLSIGEPQHQSPEFIRRTLTENLSGLARYPSTQGSDSLRRAIATRIGRRYQIPGPSAARRILPLNASQPRTASPNSA